MTPHNYSPREQRDREQEARERQAYRDGADARLNNHVRSRNPHHPNSTLWYKWEAGYRDAGRLQSAFADRMKLAASDAEFTVTNLNPDAEVTCCEFDVWLGLTGEELPSGADQVEFMMEPYSE